MNWLGGDNAHWIWLTLGVVLAAAEMLVPGVYLLWFGLAAIVTGILTFTLDLSDPLQIVNFVALALIAAFSARRFLAETPIPSSDPLMNRRGARMVGETAMVVQALEHGSGRVKYGDGEWIAHGPAIAAGERVRIVGHDGAVLLVEPLTLLADEGTQPPA
jgi:membrane protein implicated in regulation of membrane protease activity